MKKLILYIFLLLSLQVSAQEQFYNILNEDNGLLTNEVYDIIFSKEGFLFIAGDKGIQKYDGAKLEKILPSWNKSLTWTNNDKYGGLIFQSFNGKYWRYAHDSTELIFDNAAELYQNGTCRMLQGRYLAISGIKNLYWYDILNKTIDTVLVHGIRNRSEEYKSINIIACNAGGAFVRIGDTAFARVGLNGDSELVLPGNIQDAYNLDNIISLNGVEHFICKRGAGSQQQFFEIYKLTQGQLKKIFTLDPIPDEDYMNHIYRIDGKMYLVSSKGFWELDELFRKKHLQAKLPQQAISKVISDSKGGLYISTLRNGVYYKPNLEVERVDTEFMDHTLKMFDDTRDELFFLNDKGALYNASNKREVKEVGTSMHNKFSKHKATNSSLLIFGHVLSSNSQSYFMKDNKWHTFYTGGYSKVCGWFENDILAGGAKFFAFAFIDSVKRNLFSEKYSSLLKFSSRRKIYKHPISKADLGYHLKFRNKRAYDFTSLQADESFYVAYNDALYHYYPKKRIKTVLGNDRFKQKHKNKDLEIRHLFQLRNGHIWAGGFRGLMRIRQDSIIQYYNTDNGLPNNRIEFMKAFGDTLLLGFPKSVCLFSEKDGVFQNYNSAALFNNGSIKDAHIFKGELFVSTNKGIFKLPIRSKEHNKPKAFIRYVQAGDERWDTKRKIPFAQNNISIRVNGLNINSGGTFTYYYRLKANGKWTKQNNSNDFIQFNALTEGAYNFQFKVVNQWGEESEVENIEFEIAPPFLRSWLFYILCLLTAGGIIYFIFWRRGKAIRRKAEFDKQVKQSEITAIKAQMNPHFVFNALNSIQNWVITKDVENSNLYLGKFSDLVRKTLEASEKNALPLSKEIEIIQLYLDLENLRFGDKIDIQFDVNISRDKQEDIYIPAMLIQPYIENVFKHGLLHKKGHKELQVLFEEREGKFYCEIKDNGVGRIKAKRLGDKNKKHKSFSTKANRKRIDLLNEIYNDEIRLKISDVDSNQEDTGTKIQLWLPIVDYNLQTEDDDSQD